MAVNARKRGKNNLEAGPGLDGPICVGVCVYVHMYVEPLSV